MSDLYSACKDAAEPHKLEAMERIHRGMSEDITAAAPVMSIATPKSSEGGSSPQGNVMIWGARLSEGIFSSTSTVGGTYEGCWISGKDGGTGN